MIDINDQKKQLRQKIKETKKTFSASELVNMSLPVIGKLEQMPAFITAKTVLAYWSMPDEVNTHSIINSYYKSKTILLPVMAGNNLILRVYQGYNSLKPDSKYGILEPTGSNFDNYKSIDLIIVPGVAFSYNNYRLGRGKGYYDRLLANNSGYKTGLAFSFQMFDQIPFEQHDVKLDKIIW